MACRFSARIASTSRSEDGDTMGQPTSTLHSRHTRRSRLVAGLVGALGAGLLLAGCAGSGAGDTPSTDASSPAEASAPAASLAEDREWTGTIDLNGEPVGITLDGAAAPQAVASFVSLARDGYFDDTKCHRLTTQGIFVLQCGDPTGQGTGGPGYSFGPIENAPEDDEYAAGQLAMARIGGDGESMGSQFFIVYADSTIPSDAAGGYTVFGELTSGTEVVDTIAEAGVAGGSPDGTPAIDAVIEGITVE
jgi:peptidyl-prolyl cis-trans isomerase B (cyclophilin B)